MTGKLFQLPGPHRDIEALLPWHVTGRLDAADAARVAAHLDNCAECRAQAEQERRLAAAIARTPATTDQGWAMMRERLDLDRPVRRSVAPLAEGRRASWRGWRWLGWGVGAQLSLASLAAAFVLPVAGPASFHALGTAPVATTTAAAAAGNMIVIFRPDITEAQLRQTLRASAARLVDGPTAANAYVLQVPGPRRDALLAGLRGDPRIVLAEPLDMDGIE